jgi:hypothetical protein
VSRDDVDVPERATAARSSAFIRDRGGGREVTFPGVFISHSAGGDDTAAALVEAIADSLEHAGWTPLVDRRQLRGGDPWREEIDDWIATCDAAVVVFAPKALASEWVRKEVANLMFLHRERDLLVLPVLVGDVGPQDLSDAAFEPTAIAEVQAVQAGDPAETALRIVEHLAPVLEQVLPTEPLVEAVAAALRRYAPKPLESVAATLGVDLDGRWKLARDKATVLARTLLTSELKHQASAVEELAKVDPDPALRVLELVAPHGWVNPEAASRLAEIARRFRGQGAGVNSERSDTGEMYVNRAAFGWRARKVVPGLQEDQLGDLLDATRTELRDALFGDPDEDADDDELNENLSDSAAGDGRFFVIVPFPPPPAEVVTGLLTTFPEVTFLFLAGDETYERFAGRRLDQVEYLRPELDREGERRAWRRYQRARTWMLERRPA